MSAPDHLPQPSIGLLPPPPPNFMNQTAGTYHPDFMFCGACTTCQDPDEKKELDESEKLETYDDELGESNSDDGSLVLKTEFMMREPVTNPSQILVIQSLVKPLPGVIRVVMKGTQNILVVEHDASLSTETVIHALDSAGHSATVDLTSGNSLKINAQQSEPLWVRSQFYVGGICCASEVPAVRKIVRPLDGVSKLQINITTKMVHVQHDAAVISAQDVAQKLTDQGFPTRVEKDGEVASAGKKQVLHRGRTVLQVQGLSSGERDMANIQHALNRLPGVSRVVGSISDSLITVNHDTSIVTAEALQEALRPGFDSRITSATAGQSDEHAAALVFDSIIRSKFVESTIQLDKLGLKQIDVVEKVLTRNFNDAQVRAFYPNSFARSIKVEHDPDQTSILDICGALTSEGLENVYVAVDGAEVGLYLPEGSIYDGLSSRRDGDDPSLLSIHANVWISGVFWVLSMVSYSEGQEWFKWFGIGAVVFGLPPICVKAFRTLSRRDFDANCMMVTAAIGALALGEYDEAASVSFLFAVSEFLEARATMKARRALSAIVSLKPDHASVIHPISKEIRVIPADQVPMGSLLSIKTGDKIASDGVIVEGSTTIDESSLTGESQPSHKNVGDAVSGGTINIGNSPLIVRTTTAADDSAVARLIRLVEEAQSNRSPTEMLIDAFARSYTPSVMFMAIIMCTVPWLFGTEVGRYWTLNGLIIIVVACPCALTISTPVTYAAGLAATAQRGIIVKGGAKLEAMGSVDRIVFDKTGTLTKGKFSVRHLELVGNTKTREEMLQLMTLMQERSSHPLSISLVEVAKKEGVRSPRNSIVKHHTILKGEGISAQVDNTCVYVGNERLFNRLSMLQQLSPAQHEQFKAWSRTGGTIGFIGIEDIGIIGMFCVTDTIRDEAFAVIQGFKNAHIDTMICTGDSDSAAQAVAKEIGIPRGAVHSQLLPEDKLHFVGSLKRPQPRRFTLCRQKRYVLFCGDGVNDAPALAVADIGASMGEGAAMAMEISDVTFMDSNLTKLTYTIEMGKRVLRTVKENICISLLAKAAVVVATLFGKTTLLFAIASDVGIMLLVTLNGMKLLPNVIPFAEGGRLRQMRETKVVTNFHESFRAEDLEMTTPTTAEDSSVHMEIV